MIVLGYSGKSKPSALAIEAASSGEIVAKRSSDCMINWGRHDTTAELNPNVGNSVQKRVMRELFAANGVPMPRLLEHSEVITQTARGKAVIGRPDYHMKGRGLCKVIDGNSFRKALRGTRRKKAATHFME